jgi:predicted transcriptional regulator
VAIVSTLLSIAGNCGGKSEMSKEKWPKTPAVLVLKTNKNQWTITHVIAQCNVRSTEFEIKDMVGYGVADQERSRSVYYI